MSYFTTMNEVNFILDEKFDKELVQTGKVNVPFLPRVGDTVIIKQFCHRRYAHYTITDVLINYNDDFTIKFIEIFVKGAF